MVLLTSAIAALALERSLRLMKILPASQKATPKIGTYLRLCLPKMAMLSGITLGCKKISRVSWWLLIYMAGWSAAIGDWFFLIWLIPSTGKDQDIIRASLLVLFKRRGKIRQ